MEPTTEQIVKGITLFLHRVTLEGSEVSSFNVLTHWLDGAAERESTASNLSEKVVGLMKENNDLLDYVKSLEADKARLVEAQAAPAE